MKETYYIFLDECGDQDLTSFDPSFPIFTLCGVIMSQNQLNEINKLINKLKYEFWGKQKIILHSRDIRKCQNGFECLFDLSIKQQFYEMLDSILAQDSYTVISCSILKEPYIRLYGKLHDVYGLSLSFIMERTVFYLDKMNRGNINLIVNVEKRGKKEDKRLLDYYNQLLDRGTYWVTPKRIKDYFKSFEMHWKKEDIIGLQIADLVAYPITRYVLDKQAVNKAYNIIENNIYKETGKLYGLKVFP